MLKKFTVSNYRSFENPITLDLTNVRDYDFNEECIKDGLINKAVIYGENAVGKTNLGQAIFDVNTMVQGGFSSEFSLNLNRAGFLNANSSKKVAKFNYLFQIDKDEIEYTYEKYSINEIHYESLKINQELFYELDFSTGLGDFSSFQKHIELSLLNLDRWNNDTSVLRYVLSNTKLGNDSILKKLGKFIKGIFNLQAVFGTKESINFIAEMFTKVIIEEDRLYDFERFLSKAGIEVRLKIATTLEGEKKIYFDYKKKSLKFVDYASSGTLSLVPLYCLEKGLIEDLTFIYIDEFDANFHFAVAKLMLEGFKQKPDCQTVITTHNTDLMSNKYLRPDCYLLMTPSKIINLADATRRKLSMGHSLENLYQSGGFNEFGVDDE